VYVATLIKTAQQSGNNSGKVAFNPSIFSEVFRRLKQSFSNCGPWPHLGSRNVILGRENIGLTNQTYKFL